MKRIFVVTLAIQLINHVAAADGLDTASITRLTGLQGTMNNEEHVFKVL